MKNNITIIGYGGNSYLIIEILKAAGNSINYYIDRLPKKHNPYNLKYLGNEINLYTEFVKSDKFISTIGDNYKRKFTQELFQERGFHFVNCIHEHSSVSQSSTLGKGIFISARSVINPLSKIGDGVICNTGSIIEHESLIEDFAHIGPGAILCGNVSIGSCTFIGAGAVIKQGVKIGKNATVGAGSVVLSDVLDNSTVVGIPARIISS